MEAPIRHDDVIFLRDLLKCVWGTQVGVLLVSDYHCESIRMGIVFPEQGSEKKLLV